MYKVYHPLRKFSEGQEYRKIVSGEGITLKDSNGKEYKDFISGLWNLPLGYSNEVIKNSIKEQLETLPYVNLYNLANDKASELADKLYEITDGEYVKTIYTCTGSESVEVGIKLAHKYQYAMKNRKKTKIAVFDESYHGTYYGSMSASGMDLQFIDKGYGEILSNFRYLKTPFCKCCGDVIKNECKEVFIDELRNFMRVYGDELAAFIIEPILGSAGILPLQKEYMLELKRLCDEKDILLIFDEVATGFFRAGSMFAYMDYGVKPDILLVSKGINNGYVPMGATLINNKVFEGINLTNDIFVHLSTQNGNPLACASAISTIKELEEGNYGEVVKEKGKYFKEMLEISLQKYPCVFAIRQVGFMFAIELSKNREEREKIADFVIEELIKGLMKKGSIIYGYYTKNSSGLTLMPSFITTEAEWSKCIKDIEKLIKRIPSI